MPEPELYLKGYNLQKGMTLSGYKLIDIDIKHSTVKRYREYNYPIVMRWENIGGNIDTFIHNLDSHVKTDRVINSAYGNPYSCNFGHLQHHYEENGILTVNSIGYCHRV